MSDAAKRVDAAVTAAAEEATSVGNATARAMAGARVEMRQAQGWLRRNVWALLGAAAMMAAIAVVLLVRR